MGLPGESPNFGRQSRPSVRSTCGSRSYVEERNDFLISSIVSGSVQQAAVAVAWHLDEDKQERTWHEEVEIKMGSGEIPSQMF